MSISNLATSLTVIFTVTVVILAAELLFILFCRHRRHRSTQPQQPPINNQNPNHSTKELLYFLCMKTHTRVEPSGPQAQTPDGDSGSGSDNDTTIDVFKMLEANGRASRVLGTIKEDDVDEVETVSLQECFESELVEEKDVKVEVFSQCDSPMFFTPIGSPLRDGVSPVKGSK